METARTVLNMYQFCQFYNVTMSFEMVYENPNIDDMPRGSTHYRCKLQRRVDGKRRQLTTYFSMGPALCEDPDAASVLYCLASDSSCVENCNDFEDFASDLGYDPDSRKAEKIYKACVRQSKKLKQFLGDSAFEDLLYNVERL